MSVVSLSLKMFGIVQIPSSGQAETLSSIHVATGCPVLTFQRYEMFVSYTRLMLRGVEKFRGSGEIFLQNEVLIKSGLNT